MTILVVGSTGKTGRRVAKCLTERGISVRPGSRTGTPPFDWQKPESWGLALAGTRAAYIAYQPDLAVPGAVETIKAFAETALRAGTRRLVLLSGRNEEEAQHAERVVQESGAEWTIIRASWFAQNFSESFILDWIKGGEVVLPICAAKEPFIDADDIAEIAAAAFTDDRHIGQLYEVTGAELLTFEQAIGEIAQAAGRSIAYREMPLDAYGALLKQYQVPDEYISLLQYLFSTVLDGRNAHQSDGVQRALGRAPRNFTDYARATAATGVWNAPQ